MLYKVQPCNQLFEYLVKNNVIGDEGVVVLGDDSATEFGVLGYVDPVSEKN
jgi:hypothetical protein